MIDLHAHILPGLDDGAASIEEALAMCRIAAADGATRIVAAPHMLGGQGALNRGQVLAAVARLQAELQRENIPIEILPGADVHLVPELPRLLRERAVVTVADAGRYILAELPQDVIPPGLSQLLFEISLIGVTPIITHPERNREIQRHIARAAELVEQGYALQLTAASIVGDFGPEAASCAERLLRGGLAHVAASDAHSLNMRRPGLSRAREATRKMLGDAAAERIFVVNPETILAGAALDSGDEPPPRPERQRAWLGRLLRAGA